VALGYFTLMVAGVASKKRPVGPRGEGKNSSSLGKIFLNCRVRGQAPTKQITLTDKGLKGYFYFFK
jgi:hypothetical protein